MENPILYRFTGTKPLQWLATMEAYFQNTEEGRMLFPGWSGEERKVWFACKYLDIGDLDRFFQWMEGVTTKIDWEAFKACLVYQFGTFEENCEFNGIEIVYVKQKRAKKELLQKIEQVLEEESIQEIEEEQVLEEEFIKINQENELQRSIQEEEVIEEISLIQDNDSKSMESLVMTDASKFQVSFSQLEPSLQCYNGSMDVCEQFHSSLRWNMLFESVLDTRARSLGIEERARLQIITEKEYDHHLFDEMTVRKQMLYEKEIRSLFPKCWKFKFKNMINLDTHDELINLGGMYAEYLKCEEETKLPRGCGALMPLLVQQGSGPSFTTAFADGIKQRMQQTKNKRKSLFPKNWKFKFRNRDLQREKQDWRQSGGDKSELNFQMELMLVLGKEADGIGQQHEKKFSSLFSKNWMFKFKNRDSHKDEQDWRQNKGDSCVLNFKMRLLFFYGSLPRPPEQILLKRFQLFNLVVKVLWRGEI